MQTNKIDQFLGAFIGLAVGDAVGTTIEFSDRKPEGSKGALTDMVGGGPFQMPVGGWTDDTSQILAVSEAFRRKDGGYDPAFVMQELSAWRTHGKHSHTGTCFDIGGNTSTALSSFDRTNDPYQGRKGRGGGNGALCRVVPLVLRYFSSPEELLRKAVDISELTNGDKKANASSALLAKALWNAARSPVGADDLFVYGAMSALKRDDVPSDGYAPSTLLAALWSVHTSSTFSEAVLKCANLGEDSDSTAAIAGALAGAKWGYRSIPAKWRRELKWLDALTEDAELLLRFGAQDDFISGFAKAFDRVADCKGEKVDGFLSHAPFNLREGVTALVKDHSGSSRRKAKRVGGLGSGSKGGSKGGFDFFERFEDEPRAFAPKRLPAPAITPKRLPPPQGSNRTFNTDRPEDLQKLDQRGDLRDIASLFPEDLGIVPDRDRD